MEGGTGGEVADLVADRSEGEDGSAGIRDELELKFPTLPVAPHALLRKFVQFLPRVERILAPAHPVRVSTSILPCRREGRGGLVR